MRGHVSLQSARNFKFHEILSALSREENHINDEYKKREY
jgi:hypothetical protein